MVLKWVFSWSTFQSLRYQGNIRFGLNTKAEAKFQRSLNSASACFLVENLGNDFKDVLLFRKCAKAFIRFIVLLVYNHSAGLVFSCPFLSLGKEKTNLRQWENTHISQLFLFVFNVRHIYHLFIWQYCKKIKKERIPAHIQ